MPVYDYEALDSKGKTVTGIIDADGAQAARQKIRAMGSFQSPSKRSRPAKPARRPEA